MATTLSDVLQDVAAYINQDPTLPSGTDLTSWARLANQSQKEWAQVLQWRILRKPNYALTFTVSGASIGLPSNFQMMQGPVVDYVTNPPTKYYEIDADWRFDKVTTDKYIYTHIDNQLGPYLMINPVPASTASLVADIHFAPTSLATLTDVVTCPEPQFIVLRTISKILSARSDPRFPQVKADSDEALSQMIDEETAKPQSYDIRTPDRFTKNGFRVGQS